MNRFSVPLYLRTITQITQKNFVSFTSAFKTVMNPTVSDREIDLLETKDTRFRLPGNIGLIVNNEWLLKLKSLDHEPKSVIRNSSLMRISHEELVDKLNDDKPMPSTNHFFQETRNNFCCEAFDCPSLLVKDFQELFPRKTVLFSSGLTVMTLTQKTQSNMTLWTKDVNDEREKLLKQFVETAKKICNHLKENGFWADFIDPCSGRPYYSEYTPATFFETDERYRHFGFEIEDLGCCKVISHKKWGTNSYVGCVCTNAPINSDIIQSFLICMDD